MRVWFTTLCFLRPALSGSHYSVDWTTGLDYWTHGNCLWRRKEQDYTEIHTAIQESRVIFHRSQHVVLNSVRSWCKCAIKHWSHNPGNGTQAFRSKDKARNGNGLQFATSSGFHIRRSSRKKQRERRGLQ